jgi:phosphoglycolate phosphatase
MNILLFDIDGTLISTGGAGSAAMREAFIKQFGIAEPRDVPYSGRTDLAIGRELLEIHSLAHNPENWGRLRQEYVSQLPQFLPRCSGRTLPGVRQLLALLGQVEHIAMGLLTGNVREGARLKLNHYGLVEHFPFGGFGDDHLDRNHVAECALAAAHEHLDGRSRDGQVWVIGDTPLDIRCARWIGARVLAVATGIHPRDDLEKSEPDILLDDLSNVEEVAAILS